MKINFANLNIAPMPNPKPLSVERIVVKMPKGDGTDGSVPQGDGFIRNASLHPDAIIRGRR